MQASTQAGQAVDAVQAQARVARQGPFVVAAASGERAGHAPCGVRDAEHGGGRHGLPSPPNMARTWSSRGVGFGLRLGGAGRSCSDSDGSSTSTGAAASRSRLARSIRSCSQSGLGITNGWSAGGAGPDCACRALVAAEGAGFDLGLHQLGRRTGRLQNLRIAGIMARPSASLRPLSGNSTASIAVGCGRPL